MRLYDYADVLTENNVTMADKLDIVKSEFSDGYGYSAPRGLNHIRANATIQWTNLNVRKRDTLMAFFRERGGYKNFAVQLPGDTKERFFKSEEYSSANLAPGYYSFQAALVEDFALGPDI